VTLSNTKQKDRAAGAFLTLSVFVLASVIGSAWWSRREALLGSATWTATPTALKTTPAPPIIVETLNGDTVTTPRLGATHFLIVYSTTCRFCNASVKSWRRIVDEVCGDVEVVLISAESIETQRSYWRDKGALVSSRCSGHPPIVAKAVNPQLVAEQFGLRATPTHFVLDSEGRVIRTWLGSIGRQEARDSILAVLR
jgi:peroxiredoxin